MKRKQCKKNLDLLAYPEKHLE